MGDRRRILIGAGIAVLALVVFVLVPGYLASQPKFFGRFPALAEKHGPWLTSTHVEAGCEGCHVPPKPISRAVYRTRLVGEFYLSLAFRSREPRLFSKPANDACLTCHSDLRTVSPKGDLQIPHRAHVTVLKMECVECHNFLVHEKSPEGKHTPSMKGCLRCHDGDVAKDACTACHTAKAAPVSHQAEDWTIVHAQQAKNPECQECHNWTANWCVDCHTKRPQSHGNNWRATHGLQVKKHRSCEACHEADFCTTCHGETPDDNLNPALNLVK